MTYWRMLFIAALALPSTEVAAQSSLTAKCNAQMRKCNSHCNLVYERGPAPDLPRSVQGYFVCLQGEASLAAWA
jgi:hypothetical protein